MSPRLLGLNKKNKPESPAPPGSGKTDLLLRFFDSQFFDEWIALTYLYKSNSAGVQDYLCNRLYGLPEAGIEKYLSQLCQLVISRPFASLERVLVGLCAKSLRIAVKVHWLLSAIAQDQPKNKAVGELRDNCERAAMEGSWEPPFRDNKLLPLSPPRSRGPLSPSLGSSIMSRLSREHTVVSPSGRLSARNLSATWTDGAGSPEGMLGFQGSRATSPDPIARPTSPDGLGGGMYTSYGMSQGLEGLICASPSAVRRQSLGVERQRYVEGQLQISPEPEVMSPPSSPRLRHSTFGATLDFIEALCDASSGLTAFATEDRQWALRRGLEEINKEIEAASRSGIASCWFPMGTRNERIIRLAAKEASLLNSREKAPFVLIVETLAADVQPLHNIEASSSSQGSPDDGEGSSRTSVVRQPSSQYADSVQSVIAGRLSSHAAAGPGPGSPQHAGQHPGRSVHRRNDTASSRLPSPGSPSAASAAVGAQDSKADTRPARLDLTTRRSLSFSEAASAPDIAGEHRPAGTQAAPPETPADGLHPSRPSPRQQGKTTPSKAAYYDDAFAKGLQAAVDGLRGEGPLVSVQLEIRNDSTAASQQTPTPASQTTPDEVAKPEEPMTGPLTKSLSRSVFSPDRRRGMVGTSPSDSVLPFKGMGILARLGFCRRPFSDDEAESTVAPKPAVRPVQPEPHVRVRIRVHGGVDLRLGNRSSPKHRRVPSEEALLKMAAQHNSPIPFPAVFSPIPEDYDSTVQQLQQQQQQQQQQQLQRPPSKTSQGTTFAERLNGFLTGAGGNSSKAAEPSSGLHQGALMSNIGSSPAQLSEVRHAQMAVSGSNAGYARDTSIAAVASAGGQSLESDFGLDRAGSGGTASTSGDPLDTAYSGLSGIHSARDKARNEAIAVYGERFDAKCKRIQSESPHGRRPAWAVRPVIVKSGDDCRQELLAVQLISTFYDIFQEAQLPLWLRPYEVLVTSNRTALIELIPDSLSIHTIKAKSPPGTSLRDHFVARHGQGTTQCLEAQRNFVESMAGYSLVCFFMQLKDRHNGNIMLDERGHVIHIDFGFMLSNSPGGVNFEAAPFKLTRELLEVMDSNSEGKASELFDYYKVLCIQGFLACRKHADRIILLVEMMQGSGCPAFKAGPRCVHNLRKRFHLNLTETQCVEVVLGMISDSLDAWRTRQYDYYQRVLNGIL